MLEKKDHHAMAVALRREGRFLRALGEMEEKRRAAGCVVLGRGGKRPLESARIEGPEVGASSGSARCEETQPTSLWMHQRTSGPSRCTNLWPLYSCSHGAYAREEHSKKEVVGNFTMKLREELGEIRVRSGCVMML